MRCSELPRDVSVFAISTAASYGTIKQLPSRKEVTIRVFGILIVAGLTLAGSKAIAQMVGDPATGKAFALEVCTPCHVVTPDQISPPRFAVAPDFQAVANTSAITDMALHAFLTSPHPTMPYLILSAEEERNVIAYILSLRKR